jgi:hypothetical protein
MKTVLVVPQGCLWIWLFFGFAAFHSGGSAVYKKEKEHQIILPSIGFQHTQTNRLQM